MGLRGRLEAIRAPTRGKAKKGTETNRSMMERLVAKPPGASACAARARTEKNATLAKNMTIESVASDQASQEPAWRLIHLTPRSRFLAPVVTTPL
jgi:hypothetical protein